MSRSLVASLAIVLSMSPAAVLAQVAEPGALVIHLSDGSVISGALTIQNLDVETEFGKLTVPVDKINAFTPGLASRPGYRSELEALIADLGAQEVQKRDRAQQKLLLLGEAMRPMLMKHRDDADPERKKRIALIIEELDEIREDLQDDMGDVKPVNAISNQDRVVTPHFTIVGAIHPKQFTVESRYGTLSVNLTDIRRAERVLESVVTEVRKSVEVEGSNTVPMRMKSTGIRLKRGQKVKITASGKISMTPWGQNAFSTPDGAPNYGWHVNNKIPNGCLVGRIGKGAVFKIGSNHSFTVKKSGMLELGVGTHPGHRQQKFPGSYKVRIRVKPQDG
ncbi:MAG: hypothetical protein CMJ18_16550 [Phycisphaeraceae bacterium]|nr:hypothetical protein [Phycisphaeraceae bacterium]